MILQGRRIGFCIAVAGAFWLAGCSTPGTRVVLLPQEDGTPSAVVVHSKGGEQTLAQPFERATAAVGASGPPVVDQVDPVKVRKANGTLFDLAPPRAQRYTLYFEVGGTELAAASQKDLQDLLVAAVARSGGDIVVTGHTDTTGAAAQNDALSLERASQVRDMLVKRGFPPGRIEAVGRGSRDLAVPTGPNVDEPRNRRVTVVVR
jgi:outer membrane protein OmpA-like peptidoglycan-associated protein